MTRIAIDFETYSSADLKAVGTYLYATHPSTGIFCMSWGSTPDDIKTWKEGEPFPADLAAHIKNNGIFSAWNMAFELLIWNNVGVKKYGWPELPVQQTICSMATAQAMSLPGALVNAAPVLNVEESKLYEGWQVMRKLSAPKKDGALYRYEDCPEQFELLYEYNRQDVRTELACLSRMINLSDKEIAIWRLHYEINKRGIQIDVASVTKAYALVKKEMERLRCEIAEVTDGALHSATQSVALAKWVRSQGVEIDSVAESDVAEVLLRDDLPASVRRALEIRREASSGSTAKFDRLLSSVCSDGVVRGLFRYHGAATGRWSGEGVQPQNLPRGDLKPENVDDVLTHLDTPEYIVEKYGAPMDVLPSCLRGVFVARPGRTLIAVDFSAIEARVLAWLAGEESVLEVFRSGDDIYKTAAANIYHIDKDKVTALQRQVGKVAILALGYQGGAKAFQLMAKNYKVDVTETEADIIKNAWRAANPNIQAYWWDLEKAATAAYKHEGVHVAGPKGRQVKFKRSGSFLWCLLPSNRALCYPYPSVERRKAPWGDNKDVLCYSGVESQTKKWVKKHTYGGKLAENITQAVARDLLAEAMLRVDRAGFDIVMHIHDEIVVEVPENEAETAQKEIERLMTITPHWAKGLPVEAAGWYGKRYRK